MMILISIRIIDSEDHENVDITANSSPIRLIEGGGSRFVRLAGGHQMAIRGSIVWRPWARIMVQL